MFSGDAWAGPVVGRSCAPANIGHGLRMTIIWTQSSNIGRCLTRYYGKVVCTQRPTDRQVVEKISAGQYGQISMVTKWHPADAGPIVLEGHPELGPVFVYDFYSDNDSSD